MFGGWARLASPPEDLTERERTPPPAPTQLDFPSYSPQNSPKPLTSASSRDLFRLLSSIRTPQDITPQYLGALNLTVIPNAYFQDLVPPAENSDQNGPKHIPHQDRLYQTIQELRNNHSDAFREVVRLPPHPGHPRPRLSHTRNFWSGLEKMSQYWDCSMDEYYQGTEAIEEDDSGSSSSFTDSDIEMSNTDNHPSVKPTSTFTPSSNAREKTKTKQVYKGRRISTGSAMPSAHRDETVSGLIQAVVWAFNCQVRTPNLPPRLSLGNLLFPVWQSFIVGRVPREKELGRRGVLEGPVLGACCRVETNFHDDRKESGKAGDGRRGRRTIDVDEKWKEILDLAREVGVMLLLAQERAREGKEEVKPGQGKWWTDTPRWGGGTGGLMENEALTERPLDEEKMMSMLPENPTPDEPMAEPSPKPTDSATTSGPEHAQHPSTLSKRKANADIPIGTPGSGSAQHQKRSQRTKAEKWNTLRPGPGIWDPKMRYTRIGKPSPSHRPSNPHAPSATAAGGAEAEEEETKEDEIFTVTSINHHVALLNLRVSERYLAWLAGAAEEGEGESAPDPAEQGRLAKKQGLILKRTRWFDLFHEGDRVEFVEGLWRVVGWLMRDR